MVDNDRLRKLASKARGLAASLTPGAAADDLCRYADECDAEAARDHAANDDVDCELARES